MLSKKAVTGFACNAVRIWKFPFRRQRLSNETGKMKTHSNVGVEWFDQWGGVVPQKMYYVTNWRANEERLIKWEDLGNISFLRFSVLGC